MTGDQLATLVMIGLAVGIAVGLMIELARGK